ncbi:MAG: PKD domain-containing protein, partial [Draconibacterium sp.]|nr:PKD domain-containing protein [Draconibacterium sp.]
GLVFFMMMIFFATSCTDDPIKPTFPLSAEIFHSVDDQQVAFTALTHSATNWLWDFGDGTTSTEQNPVHVYEGAGYYSVTLTATDGSGNTVDSEISLGLSITPYVLLTGGATATNGKTWKLTANHGDGGDYLANADADFSVVDPDITPLPTGAFDLFLGMGEVYSDEFTFHYDGEYNHDVKDDGATFGGIVYQMVMTGGAGIVNAGGADFGLCTGLYTPDASATFTYVESEDFDVPSVYGPAGIVTYNSVSTLDFSGTEFVGFLDFQRKVIINNISENSMQLIMFMAASPDHLSPLQFNTHALVLSLEVVK